MNVFLLKISTEIQNVFYCAHKKMLNISQIPNTQHNMSTAVLSTNTILTCAIFFNSIFSFTIAFAKYFSNGIRTPSEHINDILSYCQTALMMSHRIEWNDIFRRSKLVSAGVWRSKTIFLKYHYYLQKYIYSIYINMYTYINLYNIKFELLFKLLKNYIICFI